MFTPRKYFQMIDCNFFKTDNCNRPYCHFRHDEKWRNYDENFESFIQSATKLVNEELEKTKKENPKPVNVVPSPSYSYVPTPLSQLTMKKSKVRPKIVPYTNYAIHQNVKNTNIVPTLKKSPDEPEAKKQDELEANNIEDVFLKMFKEDDEPKKKSLDEKSLTLKKRKTHSETPSKSTVPIPKKAAINFQNEAKKMVWQRYRINNPNNTLNLSKTPTISQTSKGDKRFAHCPNKTDLSQRPLVLDSKSSKIPLNVRLVYYNKIVDACLKIFDDVIVAYDRAQKEEHSVFVKCVSLAIYKKSALMCLYNLKKNHIKNEEVKTKTFELNNLYGMLLKYVLNETQLNENHFPQKDIKTGKVFISGMSEYKASNEFERVCIRCHKRFFVDNNGFPNPKIECVYHSSKRYRIRGELSLNCCGTDSSAGCQTAEMHVYEYLDFTNLHGYVETVDLVDFDEAESSDSDNGIYALDCEMSYTTAGIELTRITVVDRNLVTIYDTLVKPENPILDYNTQFSGITEEQLCGVSTRLVDVQATLLRIFNSRTILIGHSLESDMKALKLIHPTIIDTSVLFPHRLGPPIKRALKTLASEYLRKIIQNNISEGHDSAEDASSCMELVLWKLKEDLKLK